MTSYEGEVLLRYLERQHQEIVKECITVIRDGDWHAVKRALTRYNPPPPNRSTLQHVVGPTADGGAIEVEV